MKSTNENLNAKSKKKQTKDSRNENLKSPERTSATGTKEEEGRTEIYIDLEDPLISDLFFMTDSND